MARSNLLTADDRREIVRVMGNLNSLCADLDKIEACGVDCSDRRLVCQEIYAGLASILKQIFGEETLQL